MTSGSDKPIPVSVKILRLFSSVLVALIICGLLVYFSPVGAESSFQMLSGLFPAVSGETINTSTRHGLSVEIYNLGFLTFAVLAGTLSAQSLHVPSSASKRLISAALITALLSMLSATMFWPGELLINIYAVILLTMAQIVMTCIVLKLTWSAFVGSGFARVLGSIIVLILSYQGLLLPFVHTIAAILHIKKWSSLHEHLDLAAYVFTPCIAIALAVLQYRLASRQTGAAQT